MVDQISWWVELAVKPGQLRNLEILTGEMVDATRRETGVLGYARFISHGGELIQVYERYANSAAAVAHLTNFATMFGKRFQSLVERKRFTVLGNPSAELKQLLDGLGATYLKPFGAFAYWV